MKPSMHRRAVLALATLSAVGVHAQAFPSKPLTLVVPYPAGGPADVTARQMLPSLRKSLGQPVIVDNVAGASGALGIQKLLHAPPDGHQFLMGTPSDVVLAPLALAAVKHKPEQLRLLGLASRAPLVLVSGMQLPARKLEELLVEVRKPGAREYSYGSIGSGSLYHLVGEDFAARMKLRMIHVPYKGMAPLLQDVMGGLVDVAFLPSAGNLADLISQGKLRAYAVTDRQRLTRLPELPTMAQAIDLKDFEYEIWGGLFVSRSLPANLAQRLHSAVKEAQQDPEFRSQIEATGATPGNPMSLEEAERFLTDQTARYRRLAQAVKLEPQ
ncbi:MAG TPA: tripartite tricarboxylate transporter substrate binding protein [Burkholderiaceae bacterium]|nr:tripartite tricarboxylate transporter substrate binding protein [Burkholderiaceae bacterium]